MEMRHQILKNTKSWGEIYKRKIWIVFNILGLTHSWRARGPDNNDGIFMFADEKNAQYILFHTKLPKGINTSPRHQSALN